MAVVDLDVVTHNAEEISGLARRLLGDLRWNQSPNAIGGSFLGQGVEILLNHGIAPDQIVDMTRQVLDEILRSLKPAG